MVLRPRLTVPSRLVDHSGTPRRLSRGRVVDLQRHGGFLFSAPSGTKNVVEKSDKAMGSGRVQGDLLPQCQDPITKPHQNNLSSEEPEDVDVGDGSLRIWMELHIAGCLHS